MPFISIGGTELLPLFFEQVASLGGCEELWICSPFVDIDEGTLVPQIVALHHSAIDLYFVTASEAGVSSAWPTLTALPWRNFHFGVFDGWHAKIYLAIGSSGGKVCLIGSHNFTGAGAARNYEAGVLLAANHHDDVAVAVYGVRNELGDVLARCRAVYDAVSRPHDIE